MATPSRRLPWQGKVALKWMGANPSNRPKFAPSVSCHCTDMTYKAVVDLSNFWTRSSLHSAYVMWLRTWNNLHWAGVLTGCIHEPFNLYKGILGTSLCLLTGPNLFKTPRITWGLCQSPRSEQTNHARNFKTALPPSGPDLCCPKTGAKVKSLSAGSFFP